MVARVSSSPATLTRVLPVTTRPTLWVGRMADQPVATMVLSAMVVARNGRPPTSSRMKTPCV
jgi:hypothetical protein